MEKELAISRANIRFYENQGLISPHQDETHSGDYAQAAIEELRKIIFLRKLHFSISEIRSMKQNQYDLSDAIRQNSEWLQSIFFLGKKAPKAASVISTILLILAFAFLALLAIGLIYGILRSFFHQ